MSTCGKLIDIVEQKWSLQVCNRASTRTCRLDGVEANSHPLRTQAFPKKIQEEMDRLADEQMLKLKE